MKDLTPAIITAIALTTLNLGLAIAYPEPQVTQIEQQSQNMSSVSGTITYKQRIALPPGAVITVKLADVSKQDIAATIISTQTITTTGEQVPIPFQLEYDPTQIMPNYTYAVQARIELNGKLMFISTTTNIVINNGKTSGVDIMLDMLK